MAIDKDPLSFQESHSKDALDGVDNLNNGKDSSYRYVTLITIRLFLLY